MKCDGRKCTEEAAREPTIFSIETVTESLIWHLHTKVPFTLFPTSSWHFRTAVWILLMWVLRSPDCDFPALCLTHLCISMHLAAQCHTHTIGVFQNIWHVTWQSASTVQVCASFTLFWLMLHSLIHWKCDLASCTKLLEILFHGKFTSSALFQFVTIWKSPSGAGYGGWLFSAHGLILT